MKIEIEERPEKVALRDLKQNDTFYFDRRFFIVTNYSDADGDRLYVNIGTGDYAFLNSETRVMPVKLKVVLDQ